MRDSFKTVASDLKTTINEVRKSLSSKSLPTLAAGVAFYSILALFPFLAAAVAIAALLITPDQLQALGDAIEFYLPAGVSELIITQLEEFVARRADNSIVAVIAVAIAIVSASGATRNLVIASNVAYGVKDSRSWIKRHVWGVVWIVAVLVLSLSVVSLLALNSSFLVYSGVPPGAASLLLAVRWLAIVVLAIFALSVFYRYGPDRPNAEWQWISWGAVVASVAWMIGTAIFFGYVQSFANYTQTYTVFAGMVILMIWLNLSALIVVLGAEFNHQLDITRQKQ